MVPFCVGQMEAMNLVLPQIHQAGAAFVAISPQTVKQSFFMHDQHKLRFPLLSDAGNKVARQFGLTYRVPEAAGVDLPARVRESALHQWRRELGVADSGDLHS